MAVTQTEARGLWQADAARPPWFKPDLFLAANFDAEAVIRDMRRFVRPQWLWQGKASALQDVWQIGTAAFGTCSLARG